MLVWGSVRWFNIAKGYGFVDADDGKGDILLHVKELQAFGIDFVATGWRVVVLVEDTPKGRHAVEVRDARPPGPEKPIPDDAGPLEPARVRWFDRDLGYGFVNRFGLREDVFLHITTLHEYGFRAVADDPYAVTNVLFSSGTTGVPKAIPWTHLTPLKCAADGRFHHDLRPGDVAAWPTSVGRTIPNSPVCLGPEQLNRRATIVGTPRSFQ